METEPFDPCDSPAWRRQQAWRLSQLGWKSCDIAVALSASRGAVSRWLSSARHGGVDALLSRPIPGRPPRLTPEQRRQVPDFLWHGAEAYGFRGDVWTCGRIAQVIQWELGVSYHKDHVSRLMKDLGWTPQIPVTRAIQRDEAAIERWRELVWPELQQKAV